MQRQLKLTIKKQKKQKPLREQRKVEKPKSSVWGALSSLITMMVIIVLLVAGGWLATVQLFEVKNDTNVETLFKVQSGDNLNVIAQRLEQQELISSQDLYRLLVSYEGNDTRLKAGEYKIPPNATMRDIMNIFVGGQSIQHKLTFAEGLTTGQIMDKIKIAPLLTGQVAETPVEGSLMPETYLFESGTARAEIIAQMQAAQKKFLTNLWETRDKDLPLENMEEVVILASIVEKETGVASERPEVAAVFVNRIKKKMKLQSDPTIIYGITLGKYKLDRQLKKSEIKAKTPYNTYVIERLPPTPIANPGRASILAVLNPAKVDYLYFVADGTGGHVFANNYKAHQKNVKALRARQKAAK
ncbi:MAG: endolytic transglycosylase MltG [OCS116 cluster bacterium]|uniref:Endolytic murein transglycosylase n=1 Tax=OCS116 cluster bacterium TaxID=2030921 RepID=A0A2A4YQ63_9PROT|nr:endolytic transglycosylase MltG [OCS116 cluster bacterium]